MGKPREERSRDFAAAICKFLEHRKEAENARLLHQMNQKDAAYVTVQKSYFEIFGQTATAERNLATLKQSIQNSRHIFEDDFELLNKMEGVRKVEVAGEVLTIFTEPLIQTIQTIHGIDPIQHDIGQYAIVIDYSEAPPYSRKIIAFRKGPYRGVFIHKNSVVAGGSNAVCFGTDSEVGLNASMDKLCSDCDIVPMVHLSLAFLQKDTIPPEATERNSGEPPDHSSYSTPDDREAEKTMFSFFCTKIRSKLVSKRLEKDLVDLQKKLGEARETSLKSRMEIRAVSELYNAVSYVNKEALRKISEEEANLLSAYTQVSRVICEGKTLSVFFLWRGRDLVLEISTFDPPRIRTEKSHSSLDGLSGVLTSNGYLKVDQKLIGALANLGMESKLNNIFRIILGALNDSLKTREDEYVR